MDGLDIKVVREGDYRDLIRILEERFEEGNIEHWRLKVDRWLDDEDKAFALARLSGSVVGYWQAEMEGSYVDGQFIYVNPLNRGKGIAGELMKNLEDYVRKNVGGFLTWKVDVNNLSSLRVMEKLGHAGEVSVGWERYRLYLGA